MRKETKNQREKKDSSSLSDHDLLMQLLIDVKWIRTNLGNHLRHHWAATLALGGAVVTGVIAYLIRG